MRVIAGKFKGYILKMPKGVKIRPTKDMVKEALFSILGKKVYGASFLELFAGSGSIGIEAKSRGAGVVTFVENNCLCIRAIKANLKRMGITAALLPLDVERAVKVLDQKRQKFDFIFLDPPYYQDKLKNCLIKICRYDILKTCSLVIAEHSKREILPHLLPKLKAMFTKRYGEAVLTFYQVRAKQ